MDSRRTPQRIGRLYPISGFPTPETFEAGAVPSQDGLRLHHLGQIEQIGPNPRDPYQQRPVTTAADEAAPASRRC